MRVNHNSGSVNQTPLFALCVCW